MKRYCLIGIVAMCLICGATGLRLAFAYDERPEVTKFCTALKQLLGKPDFTAAHIADLVKRDRRAAEQCLPQLKSKGADMVYTMIEEILLLTGDKLDCSGREVKRLQEAAKKQVGDDKIFYLERLVAQCPANAARCDQLGDAYFTRRQFGMAIEAYGKSLRIADGQDTRTLLAKAQEYWDSYKKGKTVTDAEVRAFGKLRPMGILKTRTRKVEIINAIQTNKIRFDEWSARIKDEFTDQLQAVGQEVAKMFSDDPKTGLSIEGHTDRRGPADRNEGLSYDRAESIKAWLVAKYHLDPSRLRIAGHGPRRPMTPEDNEAGWALNRRVEFVKIENGSYRHQESRQR